MLSIFHGFFHMILWGSLKSVVDFAKYKYYYKQNAVHVSGRHDEYDLPNGRIV